MIVTTSGDGAPGAWGRNGGDITLSSSSIATSGDYDFQGADGVYVQGGSTATLRDVAITVRGANSIGVVVLSGDLATIYGGSILTGDPNDPSKGARGHGLEVNAWTGVASKIVAGRNVQGQGLSITTYGASGYGINAQNQGEIDATGATIETFGSGAHGAVSGGIVTLTDGSVSTAGQGAFGLLIAPPGVGSNTSSLTATGTDVTTAGAGAHAIYMQQTGQLSVSNAAVSATGAGSNGLVSAGGSQTTASATLSNVRLIATETGIAVTGGALDLGIEAGSVVTGGAGGLLSVQGRNGAAGAITLTADASHLIGAVVVDGAAANSAAITLQNESSLVGDVSVDTTNGAFADMTLNGSIWHGAATQMRNVSIDDASTWVINGDSSVLGTLAVDGTLQIGTGGSAGSLAGDIDNLGTVIFNRAGQFVFDGVISGSGTIEQVGPGISALSGDSSAFTGATTISNGTLAVDGALCGRLALLGSGRLQGTGSVCDTKNSGTIAPGNSIGTLTVVGDYIGQGGTLAIEALLGGDTSPTDVLAVTGATSGTTNVQVTNLGGNGAPTREGIRIVDVGGTSNGTFTLLGHFTYDGDPAVVGGAYAYRLYQGGVTNPN
ncbi:autotransporter outer membrane beta-barrel domain-containing protein, partial [Chelativorans sp.]|uniref:autotransporter outer membrane beta-barrel domain-containing protein n=1 Tax=Chelativorans sp. TaxID=2203393 RepID=UPI002810FB62